ncbi:MAG: hypothetical protein IT257_06440 [Chitinophagaceae bacterium]|nr:hypothetical protein [Chitinophagaceae bacterium]
MKSTILSLMAYLVVTCMLGTLTANAQVPTLFNYQGVARDLKGNPLANQRMSLKLSVLPTFDAAFAEYEEIQQVLTNEFGLYTLQIGNGTAITGNMKMVKWETGNKYIKVAIDPKGGTDYLDAGTTQLLSVPYAMFADKSGLAKEVEHSKTRTGAVNSAASHVAGDVNYLSKFTALNTIGKSMIYDNGNSIGIGTASPAASAKMDLLTTSGNIEHIRMTNTNASGFGKFILYNDIPANYATFTKYGSAYPGGYPGISAQYLYANLLAFGNNNGSFLLANSGNVGLGIVKGGSTTLKFNANYNSGNIGIGGNVNPVSNVHFNNAAIGDTIKITNNTSGHTVNDGIDIALSGTAARLMNRENDSLTLGTNNTTRLLITAGGNTEFNGQIKIKGGTPGAGKVLTSDANGLASWQAAAGGGQWITSGNNIYNSNGGKVGIGNLTPVAKLDVVTGLDAAGLFKTTSNNFIERGVLRAEYGGTVAEDHVAIYGKSIPDSNNYYGIGVKGDGGYNGASFTGTNLLLADPNGYNATYGAILNGISDNNATYGSFNFAGQPYASQNVLGEKTGSAHYAQGGEINTGVNTSALSTANTVAYGIYSTANGDGNNVAAYFASDRGDSMLGVVSIVNNDMNLLNGNNAALIVSNHSTPGLAGVGIRSTGGFIGVSGTGGYYGVRGISEGDGESMGVIGIANPGANPNSDTKSGVYGVAQGGLGYNIGMLGYSPTAGNLDYAGYFIGKLNVSGMLSKGGGTFRIDHPLDPTNKYLYHSFVESPDMMNVYNGNVTSNANGEAIVNLPAYFEAENKDFKYQLTVIGKDSRVYISEEINNNTFKIKTSEPNTKVSWQVTGVRQDPFANAHRVVAEVDKTGDAKGKYIHPLEYGKPETESETYEMTHPDLFEKVEMHAAANQKTNIPVASPASPADARKKMSAKASNTKKRSK